MTYDTKNITFHVIVDTCETPWLLSMIAISDYYTSEMPWFLSFAISDYLYI